MYNLMDKERWSKKHKKFLRWKEKSKWCASHEDFGHLIEECFALKKNISYLLGNGPLKEISGRKKDKTAQESQEPEILL